LELHTIIGIGFFVLLLCGLGCLVIAAQKQTPIEPGGFWFKAGFALEGFAFLLFGLLNIYFIWKSPNPTITGVVQHLRQHQGKTNSSSFDIVAESRTSHIDARYSGPLLRDGVTVRVQFVAYDHALLNLRLLSGENAGSGLNESDRSNSNWFLCAFGLFCLGVAMWARPKGPSNRKTSRGI
jgi:hypothetical protein